ncbi:MAG TPA: hypothetical protein VK476_03925 [Flavobacterium sp.]|nr:hypothetical protein [Flavobacterium sp.]
MPIILAAASYPRLLIEAFIRKNFGERYFRLSSALTVAFLLLIWPFILMGLTHEITMLLNLLADIYGTPHQEEASFASLLLPYITWYIYLVLFVRRSFQHYRDMKRNPSVFNFENFSLYEGDINPIFFKIKIWDFETDRKMVECVIEPGVFFLGGVLLTFMGQALGFLLILSSLAYGLSYVAAYNEAYDIFIKKIDEYIFNEEFQKVFVQGLEGRKTRNVHLRAPKLTEDVRRKIYQKMVENNEIPIAK